MNGLEEPSELKGTAVYLAFEASKSMTGHDLVIDGGSSLWYEEVCIYP